RLSHEKGMDLLLQAVSICADLPLNLVVIGEGPLRGALVKQAAKLGIGDRVTFAGFRSNPFVYLAAADAFVLSSRVEGFPNVVLEALACGTPVIATPCADMLADMLGVYGNGWLATAISAPALAECIRKACQSPSACPDDSYLETTFGVSRVVPQYQDLIIRLAGQPEGAG
ncbi:MAG TPA: glycosyltransferase, partial [Gammaproteobacteria bacterium]|nr:glycosyltransferase [Gammaproteobacteria bacterium]